MMNRLFNCTNKFQGPAKRVLCVCSAGLLRSPTAANVLHREFGYNTRAVGSNVEYALIPIDDVLINWADEIVFLDRGHLEGIAEDYDLSGKRCIVLNIPDMYPYMDEELQSLIIKNYRDIEIMEKAKQ